MIAGPTKSKTENILPKYLPYLTALRTKPFMLLAGISGTGKSRIVREMAKACWAADEEDYGKNCPRNFCMVQVKPNWHDSSDLIGYVSRINGEKYVVGPFLRFIAKAMQDPKRPYFLCLDEMNLAPVEQYFAEYLSVIESRKLQDGHIETDPIVPFENTEAYGSLIDQLFDSNEERKAYKTEEGGKRLTIPENLFVVGTVNMDETTFSFSRKVLDRAMSVEMNEVNYDSFLNDTTDDDLKAIVQAFEENDDADLNALLVNRHIEAKEIIDELGDDAKFAIDYLKRINALLEGTPFKLGYRAANEALIYLQASQEFGQTDRIAALDNFTLMKILSRIEGDETKLKITDSEADKERIAKAEVNVDEAKQYGDLNILTALRNIITVHLGKADNIHSDITEGTTNESDGNMGLTELSKKELQSIKKIDSMLSQLKRDHFVSFWN